MEYRLHTRGLAVLTLWLSLPGGLLSAFVFWQSLLAGAVFLGLWLAGAAGVCLGRGGSVRVRLAQGELQVRAGLIFKTVKRMPVRFVSGVELFASPLLRWAGCRVLTVHSAGMALVLAGLAEPDAAALAAALGRG